MVAVNMLNTFTYYNNIVRMDGSAQVYVICSKIKKKINQLSYSDTTKSNLINKIDKWKK